MKIETGEFLVKSRFVFIESKQKKNDRIDNFKYRLTVNKVIQNIFTMSDGDTMVVAYVDDMTNLIIEDRDRRVSS